MGVFSPSSSSTHTFLSDPHMRLPPVPLPPTLVLLLLLLLSGVALAHHSSYHVRECSEGSFLFDPARSTVAFFPPTVRYDQPHTWRDDMQVIVYCPSTDRQMALWPAADWAHWTCRRNHDRNESVWEIYRPIDHQYIRKDWVPEEAIHCRPAPPSQAATESTCFLSMIVGSVTLAAVLLTIVGGAAVRWSQTRARGRGVVGIVLDDRP